jgi:hypothetical protein
LVIGQGVIDLAPILAWGEQNGTQGHVVEQDITEGETRWAASESAWRI